MKKIYFTLSVFLLSFQAAASLSVECRYIGKIEKFETSTPEKIQVKIHLLRRSLKTWLAGSSRCKDPVGKAFSTIISSDDDKLNNLNSAASLEILAFRICPDPIGSGCFWSWNSNKLNEE